MQTILFKILVVGGFVSFALVIGIVLRRQLGDLHEFIRRTPKGHRAVLAVFLVGLIAFGGSKNDATNNAALPLPTPTNLTSVVSHNLLPQSYVLPSVTPEDIARGWRFWEVRTNAAVGYAMPEGTALATNWWMRGAYEDVIKIGIIERGAVNGDWRFPLGSNEYDAVWAYTWGKIRPHLRDCSNEIAAVGTPMSAIPGVSHSEETEIGVYSMPNWASATVSVTASLGNHTLESRCAFTYRFGIGSIWEGLVISNRDM